MAQKRIQVTSNARPYLIYAPPFSNASAGIIVLHRLAFELYKLGIEVYINTYQQNPRYATIPHISKCDKSKNPIAVYPEIVWGNPFECSTVVRFVLHTPGYWGGPKEFGKDDILFVYSGFGTLKDELGLDDDHVLYVPTVDTGIFYDKKQPRLGRYVYRGKGKQPDHIVSKLYPLIGGKESFVGEEKQRELADKLNHCECLYSYDVVTTLTEIARLCGCPVVLIPDPYFPLAHREGDFPVPLDGMEYYKVLDWIPKFDSDVIMREFKKVEDALPENIKRFVKLTQ